jgi:hypothetical protein
MKLFVEFHGLQSVCSLGDMMAVSCVITAKGRGRPPGNRVTQMIEMSPIKGAAKRRPRVPGY